MVRALGEAPGGEAINRTTGRPIRLRILCRGAVQGVGFRPSVHRLATAMSLSGWVLNGPDGVTIEIEGPKGDVDLFVERLPGSLPRLVRLDSMETEEIAATGGQEFSVRTSVVGKRERALAPPDSALCPDCKSDMENPADRRHNYPFTTCTNCGPRYSLVLSLPYDRERTAMSCFPLCPDCEREYRDPGDRRFHAEPVCCSACGPELKLIDSVGDLVGVGDEAPANAKVRLAEGSIVAVKGLGGFQLACRADRQAVVQRLRERKRRKTKPFAVMVRDLEAAHRYVRLTEADATLLESLRSPIVLAPRHEQCAVVAEVAPGISDLGIMVPTTPLHVEIFRDSEYDALVMTSGNVSDEPICRTNREAIERLKNIADLFLIHDRDVVRRVDDSVVRSMTDRRIMIRRSRGYVPEPLPLPRSTDQPLLALGAHLQATACLAAGKEAFFTPHVGDLDSEPARRFMREAVEGIEEFLETEAKTIVVDLHPDYPSTWLGESLAEDRGGKVIRVQHHLAHTAAVVAEHGKFPGPDEAVLGLALDGTGYGSDETAWGGEWILLNGDLTWKRIAHLEPIPLLGGEKAVREPWRIVCAALGRKERLDLLPRIPIAELVREDQLMTAAKLAGSESWPLATGAGRIFEAVGALLGLADRNRWEGEAAALLESTAEGFEASSWPEVVLGDKPMLPSSDLIAAAAERAAVGESSQAIAAGFHATFCKLAVELTSRVMPKGVAAIALGGGCMVNRLLVTHLHNGLREAGFEPLLPKEVPPGDGGLSYGQVALAAVSMTEGKEIRQI